MKECDGVYFGAIGAGRRCQKCIKRAELIAYEDLGAEALRKLYVEDMPLVVIIGWQQPVDQAAARSEREISCRIPKQVVRGQEFLEL